MKRYEVESIEGVGYLVFEQLEENRTRRVDGVFLNIKQVKDFLGADSEQLINLSYPTAYEEMIGHTEH
ncbi:hypothetical protein [Aliikangiella sp. IMCC44359]|uniref:hypothetical protein n=1 Tax=Aliikangiella sp. IMCC44359 TaxID=3459125 RepID=UPI00403AB9D4